MVLTEVEMKKTKKKNKKKKTDLGHSDYLKIYVNPSKVYVDLAFKSIQITYSLKLLHP